MAYFLRKFLTPGDPIALLRSLVVALSLISLYQHAVDHTLSRFLQELTNHYNRLIEILLTPLEPFVYFSVDMFRFFLDVNIEIDDSWRHIFVLLMMYFTGRVSSSYQIGMPGTAIFRLLWGVVVALVASIVALVGEGLESSYLEDVALASIAVLGILIYELGINVWFATFLRDYQALMYSQPIRSWGGEFRKLSLQDANRAAVALLLIASFLLIPFPGAITDKALVGFAVVVWAYGLFWIYWAFRQRKIARMKAQQVVDFAANPDAKVGLTIVRSYVYTSATVVIDTAVDAYVV